MQSRSPQVHAVTLLDTLLLTRNGPEVHPEGGPPRTHVVHGDRSFDCRDVTEEEIRWLQSGVVVPHVTVRPLPRRRHLRQRARRERRSRTRHCGAPVLSSVRPSSCGPSRISAVSGLLCKKGWGCPSRFAVPRASPPDSSTWTRPPRPPCAPASTASFSLKIDRRFMRWVAHRVRPRAPSSGRSLEMGIVVATEAHRRHILTMVSRLAQQARYHAARIGRARYVQPETIGIHAGRGGEHPLGSRRGLFTSTAYHGEDDGAGRSLSVKWWLPRGETVTRSCVEWRLLGCLAGWRTTPDGCAVVRAPPCVRHRHGPPHGLVLTTGQPAGPRGLCRWRRSSSNVPAKRLDGNLHERRDTPSTSSTPDGRWSSEQMEENVRSVVPHADNSVYLALPHPAGDPVTAANSSSAPPSLTTRPWSASSLQYV